MNRKKNESTFDLFADLHWKEVISMPMPIQRGPFLFCPKSGKPVGCTGRWMKWLFPVIGFVALIWHLFRVLPKPDRAAYPCQRVAGPLAWGFVAYIASLPVAIWHSQSPHKFLAGALSDRLPCF